jgi:hypothetical protein
MSTCEIFVKVYAVLALEAFGDSAYFFSFETLDNGLELSL